MASRHMKRCSAPLIIWEMEIKATVRHYLISASMATIQNQEQTKNQKIANGGEEVEKREPLCVTGGNVKWPP